MKYMKILAIDECGDLFCIEEHAIPFADGELTDDEISAMATVYMNRCELNEEIQRVYYQTDYKTSDDYKRECEEDDKLLEELLEEFDYNEDAAWDAFTNAKRMQRCGE